ncbi:unnamed protein product [Orchesella dallaii]|uniref:ERAP1-like C-terminal domain-containing protein n=1 Tax=Orchesella dallaii TaxID=48710 RepID=A0ABP1S868_9HEXA
MLKVYYLLCIFALSSSATDFTPKIENVLKSIRAISDPSEENHLLREKIPKNPTLDNHYDSCSNIRRSISETDFENIADVEPLLLKVGIENETHFIITQEPICNNQNKQFKSDRASNITNSKSSIRWLLLKIENGGLKQSHNHIQLEYNRQPFYLAGNTSEQVILIRKDPYTNSYLVIYDEHLFNGIVDHLKQNRSVIPEFFRTSMLIDYFHFAEQGIRKYESFLKLATNLITSEKDASLHEWLVFLQLFHVLGKRPLLFYHPMLRRANEFFESKINSSFNSTSFESQLEDVVQERVEVWPWPCYHFDSHCRDRIQTALNFWKSNPTSSLKSIREEFGVKSEYNTECLIVAAGGKEGFDFMLEKAEDGQVSLGALGCATEPDVVKLVLSKIVDPKDKNFQSQEIKLKVWTYYVAFNKGISTMKFVRDNLEAFRTIYGREPILTHVIIMLSASDTKEQLKEIREIAEIHTHPKFLRFFKQEYQRVEQTIDEADMESGRKAMLQWIAELLRGKV